MSKAPNDAAEPQKASAKGKYLKRQDYVAASLTLIQQHGAEKLSMRKVADHLGVSAMAVYKHFTNKNELLGAVLDKYIISQADVFPEPGLPWEDWILQIGRGMYTALCKEHAWVPILGTLKVGPKGMVVTDSFVAKMLSAGFDQQTAIYAYFTMIQLVIGAVTLNSRLSALPANNKGLEQVLGSSLQGEQIDMSLPFLIEALQQRLSSAYVKKH